MENLILVLILIVTGTTSYMAFNNSEAFDKMKFNAYAIQKHRQWYRFFTYGFIHANWMHLIFNLYVLWAFGDIVIQFFQYYFGSLSNLYFIGLYFPAIALSSVWDFFRHRNDAYYNAVGASGAVSAVVFASIILYPQGKMGLLFIPIMLPSWIFGGLYLVYTIVMSKKQMDNIGHDAHFWGAIYGIVFTLLAVPDAFSNFINTIMN